MTTSNIPPIGPNYGIGRVNSDSQGQRKGKGFQEAFEEETSDEEAPATEQPTRILQPKPRIIRRETEGDGYHIDVIV